ncbi:NifB/NifX family molybdenum-iron cluster-binding protein [candidate division KSB1 bacterium]
MKIAFTTKGKDWNSEIDERFGRTEFLVLFDEKNAVLSCIDNSAVQNEAHGAGPLTAQKLLELNPQILITGNGPGKNAAIVLETAGIEIYTGAGNMNIKEAYEAYKSKTLTKFI